MGRIREPATQLENIFCASLEFVNLGERRMLWEHEPNENNEQSDYDTFSALL